MDYSQLSNEDLLALKAGDYSKVSNEGLMALQGSSQPKTMSQKLRDQGTDEGVIRIQEQRERMLAQGQELPRSLKGFEETGEDIATSKFGQKHPYLGSALGATVQMGPEIIASLPTPALGAPVVKAGLQAGKRSFGAAKAGYTGVRDALKGTGQKEAMRLSEATIENKIRQKALQESALAAKKASQSGIQAAEERAGIGMSNTPASVIRANLKTPDRVIQFTDRMESLTTKAPKALEKASVKVLSHYRETIKAALKDKNLPQDVGIRLKRAQSVLNEQIAKRVPQVGEEISRFKDTIEVLERLGPQFEKETDALKLALKKAQNLANRQKGIRTGAKWAAAGGLGGFGAGVANILLGK